MGAVYGRRRVFAVIAIHRAFIGKGGANFPLKASKECPPAPAMVALGGLLDTDTGLATLSSERAERYSAQTSEIMRTSRVDVTEFHQWTSRLVLAAQYEPVGRSWLVSSYCALPQARRRAKKKGQRVRVFIGPGVLAEARFWLRRLSSPAGISMFPPSDDPDHRIGWFGASTSWGMGGTFLLRLGNGYVCFFYYYKSGAKMRSGTLTCSRRSPG